MLKRSEAQDLQTRHQLAALQDTAQALRLRLEAVQEAAESRLQAQAEADARAQGELRATIVILRSALEERNPVPAERIVHPGATS